jgi:hypothetical protein
VGGRPPGLPQALQVGLLANLTHVGTTKGFRPTRPPRTQRWKKVIALIENGADLPELAEASFRADQGS